MIKYDYSWTNLLKDFEIYLKYITENKSSINSYISYLNSLHKANGAQTLNWLQDALRTNEPRKTLLIKFDEIRCEQSTKTLSNWKSALNRLADYVLGFIEAEDNLKSIRDFDMMACKLVAQSAVFCTETVYKAVVEGEVGSKENIDNKGNRYGSWFNCRYKRAQHPNKRGDNDHGVKLDDNTYANKAIKSAVLEGLKIYGIDPGKIKFNGYEACHIWPKSCYNEKYHTSVANLVLLPREIAGLTDHCKAVEHLLKYEAKKRFGFPSDEDLPELIKLNNDADEDSAKYDISVAPSCYEEMKWRPYPAYLHDIQLK